MLARAYDRPHVLALLKAGVDFHLRETLESALAFGTAALRQLGEAEEALGEIEADIRRRDRARLELEGLGEREAARALMHGNRMVPKPLTRPRQPGQALSRETEAVIQEAAERDALQQDGHPV
ncbi:hypothetical protein ACFQU7_26100 [Pseudoroseomonas wenyumeiae]